MLRIAPLMAAVLVAAATAFAGSSGAANAADTTVNATNFAFSPASVTINVGDTVTWTNGDNAPHTATSTSGSPAFDTGNIAPGASGSVTFNTAGSFSYFCQIHPNMTGTIVVNAAQGATPTATSTAGGATPSATSTTGGGTPSAPSSGTGVADNGSSSQGTLVAFVAAAVLMLAAAGGFAVYRRRA